MTGEATMALPDSCDVVVVGGGVIGTAIVARLSRTSASVCLLEREHDLCEGASKGNAGVTVSQLATPGTLEAALVAASHPLWEDICGRLDVAFARVGALIVALDADEQRELEEIARLARLGGASGARTIDREQALRLEPTLNPRVTGAVLLPEEGIVDSLRLVFAFARLAALNGAHVARGCAAVGFERDGARVRAVRVGAAARADGGERTDRAVRADRGGGGAHALIATRFVVNAAGMRVGELSALVGGETLAPTPRQGQFRVLDSEWPARPSHILIPVRGPAAQTRGVQVIPTTAGTTLIGPTTQDTDDPDDTATDAEHMAALLRDARRLVPDLDERLTIKTFAANRVTVGADSLLLRRDRDVENLIHASDRAIGLSCAPAIAEETLRMLRDAGLRASERSGAIERLAPRPRLRGRVLCPCAQVSEREVRAALRGPLPPPSLEGVRKRTGAMSGRCQGALCLHALARVFREELGSEPTELRPVGAGGALEEDAGRRGELGAAVGS